MLLKMMMYSLPSPTLSLSPAIPSFNPWGRNSPHAYGIDTFPQRGPEDGLPHFDPRFPVTGFGSGRLTAKSVLDFGRPDTQHCSLTTRTFT